MSTQAQLRGIGGKKRTNTLESASTASLPDALQQLVDETRQRFVATFGTQCDSIRILVDQVAALGPRGPVAALTHATHRLSGFAGTIGFPTISARASDLEDLVGGAGRGAFNGSLGRDCVDAIRKALPKDLASPPARSTPPPVSTARGPEILVAEDASEQRAIVTTWADAAEHIPMIRVLIVDDHAIVRSGLRALLSEAFHGAAIGEAADARRRWNSFGRKRGMSRCST